jgi:hypothetical protein
LEFALLETAGGGPVQLDLHPQGLSHIR